MSEPANNPTSQTVPPATPTTPPEATLSPPPGDAPRKKRGTFGRIIKWTFVILLLLVVGGGAILWINLNRILKHTVETQGTAQLKLKTELDSANLSLFGGSLNLNDLKIGSPQGFAAPQMFRLTNADVNVKVADLRGDPVRVQSITLDKPRLVVERVGNQFNFKQAMDLMPKQPETPPDQSKPLKLIIDELTI